MRLPSSFSCPAAHFLNERTREPKTAKSNPVFLDPVRATIAVSGPSLRGWFSLLVAAQRHGSCDWCYPSACCTGAGRIG